ncbi:YlaH-like family protein [Bacillus canaveralius]|uniref:YlaH-like family protein n=1 Tax=Bacillus canaveralius TaxID=1403243 RepID=UPI000F7B01A8|nr:YlaH-like family protein [Bacillus canaveralius]RSK53524.1 hypothetical protein EJA13_08105 [Bacillus canaveralius]
MEGLDAFSSSLRFFIQLTDVKTGLLLQYLTVVTLSILVYKLGFAKKLPLLKSFIIYVCLIMGCYILFLFSYKLPVVEGLVVAAIILIIYKIRLHQQKKQDAMEINGRGK